MLSILDSEERRFRVFKFNEFDSNEFSTSFCLHREWLTCINSYELTLSIDGNNIIGLLN